MEEKESGKQHCEEVLWLDFEMELALGTEAFKLEEAVCSHGFFMMAPNQWDPLFKTLTRPFHSSSSSLVVSISQRSQSLAVRVHNTRFLSPQQQCHITAQVSRMLRLSESEEKAVREFTTMHVDHHPNRSFRGRVFRSPTLFEDMVKCILLCNCQWGRTLGMAQALCELQLELQNGSPGAVAMAANPKAQAEAFVPKTPAAKETRRKKVSTKSVLLKKKLELEVEVEVEGNLREDLELDSSSKATLVPTNNGDSEELCSDDSCHQFSNEKEYFSRTGNFPSPSELANLDESFLAKRCGLGYRARYIIELARAIVEGKIQLGQLEELSKDASLASYEQLEDQLKQIRGFGPYTRANVLMCLGYYHVIPTDSETIRHLKQVHSRNTTSKTIERDLKEIYGKYEPYQFLAFWSEIWDFYETRFGKLNEMHSSDYKIITASNMRSTSEATKKRKRPSRKGQC